MTEIARAIRALTKTSDEVYAVAAEVLSVDKAARTCNVRPLNGDAEVFDVRLQSAIGGGAGVWYLPKAGSKVIVVFISKEAAFVAMTEEVDLVEMVIGDQVLQLTDKGLAVGSGSNHLRAELDALFATLDKLTDTLMQFQLATNVGPTVAVMPQTITAITQHKADFAAIQNKLKTYINAIS
jgi:hypothetical protein